MNTIKITELPEATELKNEDLIEIVKDGVNMKINKSNLGNSINIKIDNNLHSTNEFNALAATQGKILDDKINCLKDEFEKTKIVEV